MRYRLLAIGLVIAVSVLCCMTLVTVDRTEFVYVTQFGRHVATYDGVTDAGLHLRWPWPIQSVLRLDRRLQFLDLPPTESLTHDSHGQTIDKTLVLSAYVCWRIADDGVDQFIQAVGASERAREILRQRINSQLGAEVGRMEMDDFASTEPGKVDRSLEQLRQRLLQAPLNDDPAQGGLAQQARRAYGIELVDIRLRRFNHPPQVRDAVAQRIRSERKKKVVDYQSEGDRLARDIISTAEREASDIIAEARAEEKRLRGQAEADADRIRSRAFSKDPEFYVFLKKLEEYQHILGNNKTVLLLSSHREMFDLLFSPPKMNGSSSRPTAGTAPPSTPVMPTRQGGP